MASADRDSAAPHWQSGGRAVSASRAGGGAVKPSPGNTSPPGSRSPPSGRTSIRTRRRSPPRGLGLLAGTASKSTLGPVECSRKARLELSLTPDLITQARTSEMSARRTRTGRLANVQLFSRSTAVKKKDPCFGIGCAFFFFSWVSYQQTVAFDKFNQGKSWTLIINKVIILIFNKLLTLMRLVTCKVSTRYNLLERRSQIHIPDSENPPLIDRRCYEADHDRDTEALSTPLALKRPWPKSSPAVGH